MASADFIERRWLRDWTNPVECTQSAADALRERGATHVRFTVKDASGELVAEGWRTRPADEGDLPL